MQAKESFYTANRERIFYSIGKWILEIYFHCNPNPFNSLPIANIERLFNSGQRVYPPDHLNHSGKYPTHPLPIYDTGHHKNTAIHLYSNPYLWEERFPSNSHTNCPISEQLGYSVCRVHYRYNSSPSRNNQRLTFYIRGKLTTMGLCHWLFRITSGKCRRLLHQRRW